MEKGDRVPSRLDSAYLEYVAWCQRLGYPAASYQSWLAAERKGSGIGTTSYTTSYQQSRQRVAYIAAHQP